jgi:hypothetical protein
VTLLLAIDPGNTASGWVVIDTATRQPVAFDTTSNTELRRAIRAGNFDDCDRVVIEMVASYGMAVGADVFETCVWIGRFDEAFPPPLTDVELIYRRDIKLHHCASARARDANVRQALVDRFAHGQPNHGKGTKAEPGWSHGFRADIWQAYALAVYAADTLEEATP